MGITKKGFKIPTNRLYDIQPYSLSGPRTLREIADEELLKSALRRAVSGVDAPKYLVERIRAAIRDQYES